MKNKKVVITLVVLVVAIGAYLGVTKLQNNLNRQALDSNTTVVKEEETKKDNTEQSVEGNNKPEEVKKEEIQKKEVENKEVPKQEEAKQNNTEQKPKNQNNSTQTKSETSNATIEKKVSNFLVTDSISGKSIASGHISIQDGETAESATERFLKGNGISFKNKDGYISRIGELKERDKGPNSGWCYYVNGVKASVGMRNITLKASDKIEWKYVADGVSN